MGKEAMIYVFNGILFSHKKEYIWLSSNEMDEPRAYFTEQSKSEREKQIVYIKAYIWNLERWYWWTYLRGSNGDADTDVDTGVVERVRRMEKVAWRYIHYYMKDREARSAAVHGGAESGTAEQLNNDNNCM